MTVGQRLKGARLEAGMTQKELSNKSGVSSMAIRQYEHEARQPRLEQLKMLASALEVPISALLDEPEGNIHEGSLGPTLGGVASGFVAGAAPARMISVLARFLGQKGYLSTTDFLTEYGKIVDLSVAEDILRSLMQLSQDGQLVAAQRINELTKIPEYQKKE